MTDNNSPKRLEDWEITPEQKQERDAEDEFIRKHNEEREKYWENFHKDKDDRKKRLVPHFMWSAPPPEDALALIWCDKSCHLNKEGWGWQNYWIAVRWTADKKAFELVRTEVDDEIVENYPGRYETFDHALLAANTLSMNWDKAVRGPVTCSN